MHPAPSPISSHDAHLPTGEPSPWVVRFTPLLPPGGRVLDLACGSGRHTRWCAANGLKVVAVDRDVEALSHLQGLEGVETRVLDLEAKAWPLDGESFDVVLVSNYLFRPHFDALLALVRPGGVLLYETFMRGNERFGKPSNPDFLLRPGELLQRVDEEWTVVAFEQGEIARPRPAVVQRLCAVHAGGGGEGYRLPVLP